MPTSTNAASAGLPAGHDARHLADDDVPAVATLLEEVDRVELGEPDLEEDDIREMLGWPRLDPGRDVWLVTGPDASPVGLGWVWDRYGSGRMVGEVSVHPGADAAVGPALLGLLDERAHELAGAGGSLLIYVARPARAKAGWLQAAGYVIVRQTDRMVLELSPQAPSSEALTPPAGVIVRQMRVGEERLVHTVLQDTFSAHFGHEYESFEDWWSRVSQWAGLDLSLFRLAEADGHPVGVLIGRKEIGDDGWINNVGVTSAARGRGIGRALLTAGLADFRDRGWRRGRLTVDAGNETGALRLYQSVGMQTELTWDAWQRTIPR